jgi:ribosomal protein S18 acetylase RimI-like enzyme
VTDGIVVRKATLSDVDATAVAEMMTGLSFAVGVSGIPEPYSRQPENATFATDVTLRRMQAMESVETVYLAYLDGALAGFMSLRLCPYLDQDVPYAEVMNLYVRPECQRRGVARALVAKAEEAALEHGATVMRILTGDDNHEAQAFYRAAGYAMPNVSFEKFLSTQQTHQPEVAAL